MSEMQLSESTIFKKRIVDIMSSNTITEATVIVDGEFLTKVVDGKRKLVYAAPGMDEETGPYLNFYTKIRDTSGGNVINQTESLPMMYATLKERLLRDRLYGIKVPGSASLTKCKIQVCSDNSFLILESQLYASVREIATSGKNNTSFRFGDETVDIGTVRTLVDAFKTESYKVYENIIFNPYSRKLLNKLRSRGKFFYGIQGSFVPVFINYNKVYNPFENNQMIQNTKLYKLAIEKNRYRENGGVSCYYLTQYEVCKALGMEQFMRFTPSFLYQVFVGLLFPGNENFPSATRNVYVATTPQGTRVLSESIYNTMVATALKAADNAEGSEEEKKAASKKLDALAQYEKQSSLLVACQRNQKALSVVGGIGLDTDRENSKSALAYFNYLKQAKIVID